MKTDEIRDRFLKFFKQRDHSLVRSDSLVPQNDPTLLFTGAGMNQFKDYFLGVKKDLKRAASSQKCLRTGDLDEVGRTPYHHSFFEMLGNFSFGDYFKHEAIRWAWEFLTVEMGLPPERLRISVHREDDEAFRLWHDGIKIRENWIYKLDDKTNFWPSNAPKEGPNGPCGPCSEIYFDQGEDPKNPHPCSVDHDCGRFAEIWNLVFTQYDRREGGKLVPLKQKNIDTGMGLERLACVMQKKKTNFEIDVFEPINEAVKRALGAAGRGSNHIYAISDHVRAITFAITDGVLPSNEGRGYVIRKLIRRSLWRAHEFLGRGKLLEKPLLHEIVPAVVLVMKPAYPDLEEARPSVQTTLRGEEERFLATLATGSEKLAQRIEELRKGGDRKLPGEIVFELYDTYGFPDELTNTIAHEQGFEIDQKGFDRLMAEQRKRGKQSSALADTIFVTTELEKRLSEIPKTLFLGYEKLTATAKVLLAEIRGQKGIVVLDRTPFYAESGGQVGDQGWLKTKISNARVTDTQKKERVFVHTIEIKKGTLHVGEEVEAEVDADRRVRAMRNHTATHLLHAVLRELFGTQVRQLGSLVHPDRLRFDYSFSRALTDEEISRVESNVNAEILGDKPVQKDEKEFDQAKKEGAIAFFGEKYGDRVRVVTVPGISKEFCGGTHCERTGQIGAFVITSESSIASGVRRMEALTGEGALLYIQRLRAQIDTAAQKLRVAPGDLIDRLEKLQSRVRQLEREGGSRAADVDPEVLLKKSRKAGSLHIVAEKLEVGREELRRISDSLRSQAKQTVWFLFARNEGKLHFLLGLSADLKSSPLDARILGKDLYSFFGGAGGGRKDLAEGGGTDPEAFDKKWPLIVDRLCELLNQVSSKSLQ